MKLKRRVTNCASSQVIAFNSYQDDVMHDVFIKSFPGLETAVQTGAPLVVGGLPVTRDGETILILTSKSVCRAVSEGRDKHPIAAAARGLIEAYVARGGVLWIFRACAKSGKWQGTAVQNKCGDAGMSAKFGSEYVAGDIARFVQQRAGDDATRAGGDTGIASVIDSAGTLIAVVDTSVGSMVPTHQRTGLIVRRPARGTRRRLPLIRRPDAEQGRVAEPKPPRAWKIW